MSIFSQLLECFPRLEFEAAVREHKGERHARGFNCWTQFVAMLFCQLGRAQSLSEINGGMGLLRGQVASSGRPESSKEVHSGLCQCPSAVAALSSRV